MKRLCSYLPIVFLLLLSCGCAATYPKEKVISSIVKMCRDEYGLTVIAKTADNTVGVYTALDNLLDQNFSLSPEASEQIGNVMLVIQRVALSTNANIEFYTLTVVDKKIPSVEFTLTTYVKDVKRALTLDISRGEYYRRLERNLKLNLTNLITEETFSVKPIKVSDFLAAQIAGRIKSNLEENKTLKINASYGEFKDEKFLFSVEVTNSNPLVFISGPENKKILQQCFEVTDLILRRYDFKDFKEVELKNLAGKDILRIKKEDLKKVRRHKELLDHYIS